MWTYPKKADVTCSALAAEAARGIAVPWQPNRIFLYPMKQLQSGPPDNHFDPESLKAFERNLGFDLLLITHEMEVVRQICDRVAVLKKATFGIGHFE